MTYLELKEFLATLNEEQLKMQVVILEEDNEEGKYLDSWEISNKDIYWEHHGDCLGTLEEAQECLGQDWEEEKYDLIIIPSGTVTLHI